MPAKSDKQFRFMQMIAHGGKSNKGIGPSKEVAKEFVEETPKKTIFKKKKKNAK